MANLWNSLLNVGIKPGLPAENIRKIRLLNGILATGEILFLILIIKSIFSNRPEELYVQALGAFLFLIPIIFNFVGYYRFAKYLCILIPVLYLSFITVYWGSERGSQLIILAVCGLVVLFFEKKPTILILLIMSATAIILVETYNFYNPPIYLTPNIHVAYLINILITILMIITIMGIFKKENYEYQLKIAEIYQETSAQHHKVLELNKSLTASLEVIQEQKSEIDEAHKRLQDSINYAQTIQQATLAISPDIKDKIPQHFILYLPRNVVSGDFYYFYSRESKIFIAAVDCSGHGVPGAFMSMLSHSLLQEAVETNQLENPGAILNFLNNKVHSSLKQGSTANSDGMDMSLVILDLQKMTLDFAGAKNPLVLVQGGELLKIRGDRYSLGGFTPLDYKFTTSHFKINAGDSLYLFTDGYQDQFGGPDNKKFQSKRLLKLIKYMQDAKVSEQFVTLKSSLIGWRDVNEQTDDILVIGVKI